MIHAPNGIPDLDAVQRSVNLLYKVGINKGTFDVKTHADLSYIKAAGKRLGIK